MKKFLLRSKTVFIVALLFIMSISMIYGKECKPMLNFTIYAAELGNRNNTNCHFLNEKCYIYKQNIDPINIFISNYDISKGKNIAIEFTLDNSKLDVLNNFMQKNKAKEIVFTFNEKILAAPTVKSTFVGNKFEISFDTKNSLERTMNILEQ